jgi:tetratricopeptide (TPR) repeat protein/predicted Ser/Thr protein kinase
VIGKILGNRYRVLREVGSGGMAWVYLAEDINEGRLVAIKVLYPQFSEDIAYIQRFNREAKLASTLSDQHIVRVLDYGATRDVHYLVMEYIEGQDLRGVIDERGNLPWHEALHLLDQLAMALEHAHLHGIVHRDIKPQNLMITGDGVLKVLDFGIARARMLPSLTQSGFVGSPYYISPEQAMGEEVDIRSDVYSAGVVLYEMLSGCVPYDAASPWSIISQHIASELPRIDFRDSQIPQSTESLLHRMIAKRPEDRFQTPTALREAIACVLENRPLPEALDLQSPVVPDRIATAEGLYQRAEQAIHEEDWQRVVDLLNQVIKLNPEHPEAAQKLAHAGRRVRLAALYEAARRAMEGGRWQEAVDELSEVILVDPNYRDAAELLDRVRAAQENASVAQTVSGLYEKGIAHLEAGEWEQAARCLRRVQQLSPGYKKTRSFLAEAERHLRSGPRWLRGAGATLRRVGPALALMFVFLVFVAGAYFFSQSDGASGAANLTPLATEPNHQATDTPPEQSEPDRSPEQLFREGETAYLAGSWDEAIDAMNRLRQADAAFRTAEVQDILCDAHLQRGRAQVASQIEASDTTPIEVALKDFGAGLAICPGSEALSTQQDYADSLLLALKGQASEDWNAVIEELTPVVTAEPDYANGNARHMLYAALVARGDTRQQIGDLAGALSDYEGALALDKADPLDATSRRVKALRGLSEGAPSVTLQPGVTPTPLSYKYVAPTLVGPEDGVVFQGEFTLVLLAWEPVGALADDEYYDVTVMHYMADEPQYWGDAVKETQWRVPVEAGFQKAGNDRFYWWVTVRQANTAPDPDQLDLALSPPSDARIFYWGE